MELCLQHVHRHVRLLDNGCFLFWFRQSPLVHLLILVQWDSIYLHRHGRHHIRWFLVHDKLVECLDIYLLVANDISSNELTTAILIEGLHGSILDARELTDDALHLLQFDTESTYLHLSVTAPHKLDVAIGQETYDITCTIGAQIFLIGGERIIDVYFCCLLRTVQITPAHLWTGHPQFTGSTHRKTMSLGIYHIQTHIVERLADRYLLHLTIHAVYRGEDRTFGRTIDIKELISFGRREGC